MFDPVRLFWTTLEVVLESLCEGGAQGSNFYKWTTLQDTAIRNKHQSIFHALVYTTYILPLRLCRFRFGMRFCSFFLIFTFTLYTCLWLFGFEQDAQGIMLLRFRNVTRVRTPLHGHPKLQTRFCSGQPKAKQNPNIGVSFCCHWLGTYSDFGLAHKWRAILGNQIQDTTYHVPARWCQEAWLAPLICLHLGCKLGISDVFGFGTVESVGRVHGFYCIENKFLWPVYHNTSQLAAWIEQKYVISWGFVSSKIPHLPEDSMVSRCQESCDLVMFNFATVRPSTSGTWWALSSSESWRRGFSGLDSKALRKCIYFASVAWVDEILYGTLAYPCTFRLSTPTLGVRGNFAKELLLHFSTWTGVSASCSAVSGS